MISRRSGMTPRLAGALQEHKKRARDTVAAIEREYERASTEHWDRQNAIREWADFNTSPMSLPAGKEATGDPSLLVSLLIATASSAGTLNWSAKAEIARNLARRRLPYTADDVSLLFAVAEARRGTYQVVATMRIAVGAAESFVKDHGTADVEAAVRRGMRRIEKISLGSERTSLLKRFRALVAVDKPVDVAQILDPQDDWAKRAKRLLRDTDGGELITLAATATSSRPSARWKKAAHSLAGPQAELIVTLLTEAATAKSRLADTFVYGGERFEDWSWLSDMNATVVRGLVWSLVELDEPPEEVLVELLPRALAYQTKVANACIYALGEIASDGSLAHLSQLRTSVSDRGFLKQIDRALESAAASRGLSSSELREALVADHDLVADSDGDRSHRTIDIGASAAVVTVQPGGKVETAWRRPDGAVIRTVPAGLKDSAASEIRAVRTYASTLRSAVTAERLRLEEIFVEDRVWTFDAWRGVYIERPLIRPLASRLIWRFGDVAAMPVDGELMSEDGSTIAPSAETTVRLWHPIDASVTEVAAWRTFLAERELLQPFKQAFREIYVVAPAELETRVYSNRFAAHVIEYPKAYALIKGRGWGINALGPFDNDGGRQWRDFSAHAIRAELWIEPTDDDMDLLAAYASTDQVRFTRSGESEPMALADVPPIVFSEAMRDVDLFVSVCSIAGDPTWMDRGEDRYLAYWRSASFGELSASGAMRREVLAELIPKLSIADRLKLEERTLRVRGDLRTYRIHLGSANIMMEPDDQYLCIVPSRNRAAGKVFLPFEDDRLSVILSKAFLLAVDATIKDETIVQQLRARRG